MKLKKYLSSLLAIALLASCSNDGIINDNTLIDTVPEGAVAFNVSLPGRTFQPTTYATLPAEESEKALTSVRIYIFQDNGGSIGNLIATERLDLKSNPGDNTEDGVKGTFYMRKHLGQEVQMVAVANRDFTPAQAEALRGMSFEDFSKQIITQSPSVPNKFPMVSEPVKTTVPANSAPATEISFRLKRLAVRVDIQNLTKEEPAQGRKMLTITDARLRKVNKKSYLMEQASSNFVPENVPLSELTWVRNTGGTDMFSHLYTYENLVNTEAILDIKGTIDGAIVQFAIPLERQLKRNTRYLVKVNNVSMGNEIDFTVTVDNWKDGGEASVGADSYIKETEKPTVVSLSGATALTESNTKLVLTDATNYSARMIVKSLTEVQVKVDGATGAWLKVKKVGLTEEEKKALDFGAQALEITATANSDNAKRTAKIVIEPLDNTDNGKKHEITVEQPGA